MEGRELSSEVEWDSARHGDPRRAMSFWRVPEGVCESWIHTSIRSGQYKTVMIIFDGFLAPSCKNSVLSIHGENYGNV